MTTITPFLWLDNSVRDAVAFYTSVFPNAKVETVNDFMATFELEGQRLSVFNGGPMFKFNEAVSFFISVKTQQEVDYFWDRLTAEGGQESRCGWLKDKFGLSWQVVPESLSRCLHDPDRQKANRAMQAMLTMNKIVIADIEAAFRWIVWDTAANDICRRPGQAKREPGPTAPAGNVAIGSLLSQGRHVTASALVYRRDNRRSRAGSCARASRPRHTSPAADTDGILSPQAPRATPA